LTIVYIVDEERHFAESVASAFRLEGYSAFILTDATEALNYFVSGNEEFRTQKASFLVDVSLLGGDDTKTFNVNNTNYYYHTGLVLIDTLINRWPGMYTSRNTVLYTANFLTPLWDEIARFCAQKNLTCWQKLPMSSPLDMVNLLKQLAIGND